ncbi:hypothetical protein BCR43DRAFT_270339 [Syncephalastrum racemosum]|uniref:Extracellular membrane protein CFEM domain-containing protein n=1 Tax=Syncephalastrum racemosum TaxID=13706 RepID=A0A1X2HBX7_SYNRA|nr:hypothetical protein BCR43DRAFT_270339 [Syncephalastrum racemosum]
MRQSLLILILFVSATFACKDNPVFKLCEQTAKVAVNQCTKSGASCHCLAEKQMLACFAECPNEQDHSKVEAACKAHGAEAEAAIHAASAPSADMPRPTPLTNLQSASAKASQKSSSTTVENLSSAAVNQIPVRFLPVVLVTAVACWSML